MTEETTTEHGGWELLTYPDKRLRQVSKPIIEITDEIRKRGLALMDFMHEARGIGLAAPQVNWHVRLLAINLTGQRRDGLIFLNPEIVSSSKATFSAKEACLSVPGVSGKVVRPRSVTLTAMNFDGAVNEFTLDGMLARCFLHEYDHLDGKLYIDRLSAAGKLSIKGKLKKLRDEKQ